MTSRGHLSFNITKAAATTSTTNTTTTSVPGNVKPVSASATRDALSASLNDSKTVSSDNMATGGQDVATSGIKPVTPTTTISGINSSSVTTLDPPESSKDGLELLDIWGKYDLNNQGSPDEECLEAENVDILEEKMEQIQITPTGEITGAASPRQTSLDLRDDKSNDLLLTGVQLQLEETLDIPGSNAAPDIFENSEPLLSSDVPITQYAVEDSGGLGTSPTDSLSKSITNKTKENRDEQSHPSAMGIQPYVFPDESKSDESKSDGSMSDGSKSEGPKSEGPESDESKSDESKSGERTFLDEVSSVKEYQPSSSSTAPRLTTKRRNSLSRITHAVNPEEQHQQSHKPFDFQVFLAHLKNKSADPLVRYIQSFLVSFSRQSGALTVPQMIKAVRNFKEFMNEKFHEYEPFASMDSVDLENSGEGVEKLIMNRLYDYCFSPEAIKKFGRNASASVFDDFHEDYEFTLQLEKFSWILAVHLDVDLDTFSNKKLDSKHGSVDYIDYAVSELNKINKYRAPRDKIICILNACKIIFNLLENSGQETNADAFIPILIIVIIRAKTDNLISNIKYIERYRGDEWLNHGETSYYLSSMQAAISFLQNVGMEDLTIEQSEYEANMEAWEAELRQRGPPIAHPEPIRANSEDSPVQESLSPSSVILAGAEMFTKSLSSFMSPSPLVQSTNVTQTPQPPQVTDSQIDETSNQLAEIFPSLDRAVLRDVVIMKKGNFDSSLDVCLQLCSDN